MLWILGALAIVAALYDLRFRRIPNWLTGSGWLAGMTAQGVLNGWPGLQEALLGSLLGFGVYLALYALRAMGGGDVKLMAAVGAFTGPREWFVVFVLASLIGGAVAVVAVLTKGELTRVGRNMGVIVWELIHLRPPHGANPELDVANDKARTLPHGVSIAAAVLLWVVARN
jgi:prepilin peptidase CpaA